MQRILFQAWLNLKYPALATPLRPLVEKHVETQKRIEAQANEIRHEEIYERHRTGPRPFGARNGNLRENLEVRADGKRLNIHQKFSITAATNRFAKSFASRSSAGSCSSKKPATVAPLTSPVLGFTTVGISYSFRNRKLSV